MVAQTAGGSSATSAADQFFYGSPPTATGLSASSGPGTGGTTVTISGTGFTGATDVGFGGLPASSLVVESDTEIQATTPPSLAGTVDVQVVTPAGTSPESTADQYTYLVPVPSSTAPPAISGTPHPGQTLNCSNGSWSNDPTTFAYSGNVTGHQSLVPRAIPAQCKRRMRATR